jgi:hypothetical protein
MHGNRTVMKSLKKARKVLREWAAYPLPRKPSKSS